MGRRPTFSFGPRKRGAVPQAKAAGAAVCRARQLLGLTQEMLGRHLGIKARSVSRWEVGKSGPSRSHRAELVHVLRTKDASVADALAAEFARLYPVKGGAALSAPVAPRVPGDPAALDRSLVALADVLDVAPRRARAFALDALRAVHAAGFDVEEAIALLAASASSAPTSSTT